jgi:hypothetical protein
VGVGRFAFFGKNAQKTCENVRFRWRGEKRTFELGAFVRTRQTDLRVEALAGP